MARTKRESDRRRKKVAVLLVLPRPAKSLLNCTGHHKSLNTLGVTNRKGWLQRHQESSWQGRWSFAEQSHSSKSQDRVKAESQGGK